MSICRAMRSAIVLFVMWISGLVLAQTSPPAAVPDWQQIRDHLYSKDVTRIGQAVKMLDAKAAAVLRRKTFRVLVGEALSTLRLTAEG